MPATPYAVFVIRSVTDIHVDSCRRASQVWCIVASLLQAKVRKRGIERTERTVCEIIVQVQGL